MPMCLAAAAHIFCNKTAFSQLYWLMWPLKGVSFFLSFSSKAYRVYLFFTLLTAVHELWGWKVKTVCHETIVPLFYVSPQSLFRGVQRSAVTRTREWARHAAEHLCVCVFIRVWIHMHTHTKLYIALMLAHTCGYKRPGTTTFSQSQTNSHLREPISKCPRWPDPHYFTRQP